MTLDEDGAREYENYGKFPFTFLASGEAPAMAAQPTKEEWFLRVQLKTAEGLTAGTDADIRLRAGGKTFLLDYLPKSPPVLAYDDFSDGDDDSYVVGPFDKCPDSLDLINDGADSLDVAKAAGRSFVSSISKGIELIGGILGSFTGAKPDLIATNKQLWTPEDLAAVPDAAAAPSRTETKKIGGLSIKVTIPAGKPFSVDLNGDGGGHYRLDGFILKTGDAPGDGPQSWREFQVRVHTLTCIKETNDRGFPGVPVSDKPFLMAALNPLPSAQQPFRTAPIEGMDEGEVHVIDQVIPRVRIPKGLGMLNFAVCAMEHDGDEETDRKKLLDAFLGKLDDGTKDEKRTFTQALAASGATNWKLDRIQVTAWSRNGEKVHVGSVHNTTPRAWIPAKQFKTFALDVAGAADTGVTTDELLPELGATPPAEAPQEAPSTSTPETPATAPVQTPPSTSTPEASTPPVVTPPESPITGTPPTTPLPPTLPALPTAPTTPTVPVVPGTSTGAFRPLGEWAVQVQSMRVARGKAVEVVAVYKNVRRTRQDLLPSIVEMIVTDSDGIGISHVGNLYRAGDDPDMEPEQMRSGVGVEPGASVKTLVLFEMPAGTTQLKTLSVFGSRVKLLTYDISRLALPDPLPGVKFPIEGAVAGTSTFADFNEFGLRLDGVRRGRDNKLQVIVTVRNIEKNLFISHPRFNLEVAVVDNAGISHRNEGNIYRASGLGPQVEVQEINVAPNIVPGAEATVCYQIEIPAGAKPKQLVLQHKDKKVVVNLTDVP